MVEIRSKNRFSGTFLRVFNLHPLIPYELRPNFGQVKGLIKIHNSCKFHQYSICGCQVICFKRFLQQQKVQFLAAFGGFFMHFSPK